jgi:hypothetical protein
VRQNEYSVASVESKRYALKEFASFVKKADPATVTPADVDRFYQKLRARVAESTAWGYITTLRSFFNRLLETRKVRTNVVKAVKLARVDTKGRTDYCTPAFESHVISSPPAQPHRPILSPSPGPFHSTLPLAALPFSRAVSLELSHATATRCGFVTFNTDYEIPASATDLAK